MYWKPSYSFSLALLLLLVHCTLRLNGVQDLQLHWISAATTHTFHSATHTTNTHTHRHTHSNWKRNKNRARQVLVGICVVLPQWMAWGGTGSLLRKTRVSSPYIDKGNFNWFRSSTLVCLTGHQHGICLLIFVPCINYPVCDPIFTSFISELSVILLVCISLNSNICT